MKKSYAIIFKVIMALYMVCLFWAAVIHRINDVWTAAGFTRYAWAFTNVIPFRTFFELAQTPGAQNVPVILHTFLLNFLALIPFGILFCLIFREKKRRPLCYRRRYSHPSAEHSQAGIPCRFLRH